MEHSNTKSVKTAPLGFSVTSLFFGAWVCAWRQDYRTLYVWAISVLVLLLTGVGLGWFSIIFLGHIYQAVFYNRHYLQTLLDSGWRLRGWVGLGLEEIEFKLGRKLPRSVLTS